MSDTIVKVRANSKAHHALRLAIGKWIHIRDKEPRVANYGAPTCALCFLFSPWYLTGPARGECEGCPVKDNGHRYCDGSPYDWYHTARLNDESADKLSSFASAEVKFLKLMLPDSDPLKHS